MVKKRNPLNLNPLQLRTLTLLQALATLPDVEKEATRTIQRAARDPAFSAFQKEARTALGE